MNENARKERPGDQNLSRDFPFEVRWPTKKSSNPVTKNNMKPMASTCGIKSYPGSVDEGNIVKAVGDVHVRRPKKP